MPNTDYADAYRDVDFRKHPEKYQIGRGEQGVLLAEPYKSEILPYWRFKTPTIADASAKKIYTLFETYLGNNDFVGADMARKFLQMGFTRARRYANHAGGKKYESNPQKAGTAKKEKVLRAKVLPQLADWETNEKAASATIFQKYYKRALREPRYISLKAHHQKLQRLA